MTVDVLCRKRNVKAPKIACGKCSCRLANPAERVHIDGNVSVCLDVFACDRRARRAA